MALLIFLLAFAEELPPTWIQSKHGYKMLVTYQPSKSGPNLLVVAEKDQITGEEKETQQVDLELKGAELVSNHNSFYCVDAVGDTVYAVVGPGTAKEKGKFSPNRAWSIDQKAIKLTPVKDLKKISCEWTPEGGNKFPFGKKSK